MRNRTGTTILLVLLLGLAASAQPPEPPAALSECPAVLEAILTYENTFGRHTQIDAALDQWETNFHPTLAAFYRAIEAERPGYANAVFFRMLEPRSYTTQVQLVRQDCPSP